MSQLGDDKDERNTLEKFMQVFVTISPVLIKKNKTPAEERDIFRPELFYNYINLRLKNN